MFTGIVKALGTVVAIEKRAPDAHHLVIDADGLELSKVRSGDSISVNGVCLTVTDTDHRCFGVDIGAETLACTTLGGILLTARVNLEPALCVNEPLGGHLVSGHVDGVGKLRLREENSGNTVMRIDAPEALMRYVAVKGSICVDGVSLTVNRIDDTRFEVALIPHTLTMTTLGLLGVGQMVNLEIDLIARYLHRLLQSDTG